MNLRQLVLMGMLGIIVVLTSCQKESLDSTDTFSQEELQKRSKFCNCEINIDPSVKSGALAIDIRKNSTGTELPVFSDTYGVSYQNEITINEQIGWNSDIIIYFDSNVKSYGRINVSIDCQNGKVERTFCVDKTVTPLLNSCPVDIQLFSDCRLDPQDDDACEFSQVSC